MEFGPGWWLKVGGGLGRSGEHGIAPPGLVVGAAVEGFAGCPANVAVVGAGGLGEGVMTAAAPVSLALAAECTPPARTGTPRRTARGYVTGKADYLSAGSGCDRLITGSCC